MSEGDNGWIGLSVPKAQTEIRTMGFLIDCTYCSSKHCVLILDGAFVDTVSTNVVGGKRDWDCMVGGMTVLQGTEPVEDSISEEVSVGWAEKEMTEVVNFSAGWTVRARGALR